MLQQIKLSECQEGDKIAFKEWQNGQQHRKIFIVGEACIITRRWTETIDNGEGGGVKKTHQVKVPAVWLEYQVQDGVELSESGFATRPKWVTKRIKQPVFDANGNDIYVLKIIKIQ